ncbi:hypothetical protein TKK_0011171 [Trichogramma kaykai]|uniref:LisH domain-containing protein n=1 Tax=Trichogramma kaykai TaxID=54128 RepID=A0ABD2WV67_9HYME
MEDDYFSSVYSWFDKCGIIANIRTHLRQNLVNTLKNRDASHKLGNSCPRSAKQYVYDLLIAEYLWNHNYFYTLSVFASEVPLMVDFNKQIKSKDNGAESKQKLQSDYVCHTLETLGIEPTNQKGKSIISDYAENDVPLLLSILKCIRMTDIEDCNKTQNQTTNQLNSQYVQTVEIKQNLTQELSKLTIARKKLIQQKDLFEAQLKQREIELKEQALVMKNQLLILQEKLNQAQKLIDMYSLKEKRINENKKQDDIKIMQKEKELSLREKILSQEAIRIAKEKNSYQQFKGDLKKLQDELLKVKREIPLSRKNCNLSVKDTETQTDFENYLLTRNEQSFLNLEKNDLGGLVSEQQSRIEQLTSKVVILSRKLEEKQLKGCRYLGLPLLVKNTNITNGASESSSTEDILQDAKMRLRRLEEESLKADQYYFNFITNSS